MNLNDLTGWNFAEKNLTGADFRYSTLTGADFSGATIANARLIDAIAHGFTEEQFASTASYTTGALTGIWLSGNDLTGWNFAGKNLTETNLSGATLTDVDFSNAIITGIGLAYTIDKGFTKEQLESTSSFATGNLSGIVW